ncbi:C-type natriuretic peptide [Trichomycterus rosablanca]|uniref:C-type natriuretic peptide n=1 Tax=Trichomycterus rosablanca TaxID=2290929 RepID=UPI002F35443E
MNAVQLLACGLILSLLAVRTDARPSLSTKALEAMLGEEVANFLASGDRGTRTMRGLAMDARARGMWARLMNDQGGSRKQKSGTKKGAGTTRSGCFGHKMDRIGTISGMGCQPAYYPSTNNLS